MPARPPRGRAARQRGAAMLGEPVRRELGAKIAAALVRVAELVATTLDRAVVEQRRGITCLPRRGSSRTRASSSPARASDVGVMRTTDRVSDGGSRDSVMSGRCVPPVYGSLRTQTSRSRLACPMTAATASGIAPRCTGMCSAWAIISARVEERGRAVPPFLDVGRERRADQRRAHLLRNCAESAADHLQLHGVIGAPGRASRGRRFRTPTQPSGTQQSSSRASSMSWPGPAAARRPTRSQIQMRAGTSRRGRAATSSAARGRRSRSVPRALGGSAPQPGPSGTGARRTGRGAKSGVAFGGQLPASASGTSATRRGRAARRSLRGRGAAARRRPLVLGRVSTPVGRRAGRRAAGRRRRGDQREVARIVAALDRTTRSARKHLRVDHVDHGSGGSMPSARSAAPRSSATRPSRIARRRPSNRFASVTVGAVPPRA